MVHRTRTKRPLPAHGLSVNFPDAMIDWQPMLEGTLLKLRPLKPDDFDALHVAASDPLIWEQHPEPTRWQRDVFRGYFDSGLESRGALVVHDRTTGAIIGSSRFTAHDAQKRSVEIGYTFLTRAYWGGRFNGELKALMLEYAFRHVDTVCFVVGEKNLRSRRALEKIGAVLDHAEPPKVIYALKARAASAPSSPSSPR